MTSLLKQIEHDNPHGGVLVGLEHRLKGADRLKEKIADKMNATSDATLADAAGMIDDAVRYTFCFGSANYVTGHEYPLTRQCGAAPELPSNNSVDSHLPRR